MGVFIDLMRACVWTLLLHLGYCRGAVKAAIALQWGQWGVATTTKVDGQTGEKKWVTAMFSNWAMSARPAVSESPDAHSAILKLDNLGRQIGVTTIKLDTSLTHIHTLTCTRLHNTNHSGMHLKRDRNMFASTYTGSDPLIVHLQSGTEKSGQARYKEHKETMLFWIAKYVLNCSFCCPSIIMRESTVTIQTLRFN